MLLVHLERGKLVLCCRQALVLQIFIGYNPEILLMDLLSLSIFFIQLIVLIRSKCLLLLLELLLLILPRIQ